jgi:hypothetical protein
METPAGERKMTTYANKKRKINVDVPTEDGLIRAR